MPSWSLWGILSWDVLVLVLLAFCCRLLMAVALFVLVSVMSWDRHEYIWHKNWVMNDPLHCANRYLLIYSIIVWTTHGPTHTHTHTDTDTDTLTDTLTDTHTHTHTHTRTWCLCYCELLMSRKYYQYLIWTGKFCLLRSWKFSSLLFPLRHWSLTLVDLHHWLQPASYLHTWIESGAIISSLTGGEITVEADGRTDRRTMHLNELRLSDQHQDQIHGES